MESETVEIVENNSMKNNLDADNVQSVEDGAIAIEIIENNENENVVAEQSNQLNPEQCPPTDTTQTPSIEPMSYLEYFLTHYRSVLVVLFLLPMSFIYDIYLWFRDTLNFIMKDRALGQHSIRVEAISAEIKKWIADGRPCKMCTARPGHQTMSLRVPKYKKSFRNIPVFLYEIIKVDTEKRTVIVEPMVTMGQLSRLLNSIGWTIPVLPELDDLTVGGLVAGCGVETSSHKYGMFQHTCVAYEIVLSDGRYDIFGCVFIYLG